MNLLERVLILLRANLDSVVEKSDDPEKVLRQLQLDMRNQLVQVKTQVATAIAASHKLRTRSKEKVAEAETWLHKAEQAIQHNNDDAARSALTRYNDILKQAQRYQQQQKEQEQLVATMRDALRQLEAKIAEVETTIELLVARKRNALIQQRVLEALNKAGSQQDRERASRAQEAVMEAEARARALADLHRHDLDSQLEQLSSEQLVEQQLHDLKVKQQARQPEPPLLQEGKPHLSPLVPPQPVEGEPVRKQPPRQASTPHPAQQPAPESISSSPDEDAAIERLKNLLE
jgi:phage shock protein A